MVFVTTFWVFGCIIFRADTHYVRTDTQVCPYVCYNCVKKIGYDDILIISDIREFFLLYFYFNVFSVYSLAVLAHCRSREFSAVKSFL